MKTKHRTPEVKLAMLDRITASVKDGTSIEDACDAEDIFTSQYYDWKKKLGGGVTKAPRRKLKPKYQAITIPDASTFSISGSPSQIAAFIRELRS